MRTVASLPLALLMQAQGGPGSDGLSGVGIFGRVAGSSFIAQLVLLTLVMLSIVSWSIFLYKWWTFRRIRSRSAQFLDVFRRSNKFSEVQAVCRSLDDSPLVTVMLSQVDGRTEMMVSLELPPHLSEEEVKHWFSLGIRDGMRQTVNRLAIALAGAPIPA